MARGLRDIRRKMKAVKSTRQVTKAMELVAASKMRRAVQNAQSLSHYAAAAWHILRRIADLHPGIHPFLMEREVKSTLVVMLTSDRGLCGSLNTHLFRQADQFLKTLPEGTTVEWVAVGRKGQQFLSRMGQKIVAAFPAFSNHPRFRDVVPLSKLILQGFNKGTYDKVTVIYPHFISALTQKPEAKTLLPLTSVTLQQLKEGEVTINREEEFLFEPTPETILETVVPQLTEIQIYQAILETAASEHSARMVAMRSATDNASGLLDDLTLSYNRTRQGAITAELAELSASAAALS